MVKKVIPIDTSKVGGNQQNFSGKKTPNIISVSNQTEIPSVSTEALDAYKAMIFYKKSDADSGENVNANNANGNTDISQISSLNPEMLRLMLLEIILKMMELTDLQDDGIINGSVYDDPEVADLFRSYGSLGDGSNYDSIMGDIKRSTGQNQKTAINKMQQLHKKGLNHNYDTYIDKKPGTNPDPKIGTVPGNKPAYISDSDWSKIQKLDPKMQAAVCTLYEKASAQGLEFHIKSGLRSHEEQERIYRTARPGYAAKPGSSQHELGNAIDIEASKETKQKLGRIWKDEMGLKWGQTFSKAPEDWHFDIRSA
ncbi:MAG: M15 family metallopeptidase [Cyanobacteriota bacterium]